ncbi:substrate-binding periplasmic protein [Bowmanella denitrificans]|uniref:substrate-binding periplasmic protein n=1 Tax=Bowmanella denitrificans TaxID=366582 RepID=UPI0031D07DCD
MNRIILLTSLLLMSTVAQASSLVMAVGWTKPPYVIADQDKGFELDLVRAILQNLGHQVDPVYVPFGRSAGMLNHGQVDMALNMTERMPVPHEQLSQVYVTYRNVVISLKVSRVKLDSMADMKGFSIVAFQNASIVLGQEFAKEVSDSRLYTELPDQSKQVKMLLEGRIDLAVMDINIFRHISTKFRDDALDLVDIHWLFPPTGYRVGFKDKALLQEFDKALQAYRSSDQYPALIATYDIWQPGF